MARLLLMLSFALVALEAAHAYILLTANLEDVQNVAKRLVKSQLSGQVQNIMRRAYSAVKNEIKARRANKDRDDEFEGQEESRRVNKHSADHDDNNGQDHDGSRKDSAEESSKGLDDKLISTLGKHASVYLKKIRKIFEDVVEEN